MRRVEMHPSCQFVHQNVPDALASSKSLLGRQNFHKKLDTMTLAAAKEENCDGQYKSFCDVISFDDSKDVFYFPSLWKGDPPMAPVNEGYIEGAQQLKSALVQLTKKKQSCQSSFEVFKSRIDNLWTAVLQENFVFSFKNTLEVCVYNELDVQYGLWSWRLQFEVLQWQNNTRNVIQGCDPAKDNLENIEKECIQALKEKITTEHTKLYEEMETFIEQSEHSEILLQWKNKTEQKLKYLCEERKKEGNKFCDDLVKHKLNHAEVEKMNKNHITDLQSHIRKLVNTLDEGKKLTRVELESEFETKWEEWMHDFKENKTKKVTYPTDLEIENELIDTLIQLMGPQEQKILRKQHETPLRERSDSLQFVVKKDVHLSSTKWLGFGSISQNEVNAAEMITKQCIAAAQLYLDSVSKKLFDLAFAYKLLNDLFKSIDSLKDSSKCSKFIFTPDYKIDISLVVCSFAYKVFKGAKDEIKNDNDPIKKLENLKDNFQTTFYDQYFKVDSGKAAASSLCKLLEKSIEKSIKEKLESLVVDGFKKFNSRFCSKRGFKIELLRELTDKNNFYLFKQYLDDIDGCFRHWTEYFLQQYCLKTISDNKTRITIMAEEELLQINKKIKKTVEKLNNTSNDVKISVWLDSFRKEITGTFSINIGEMEAIVGIYDVADYKIFSQDVENRIEQINENLLQAFSNGESLYYNIKTCGQNPPHLSLYKSLIGCNATCPFCKEQCEKTDPTHSGDHHINLHRPECLGRYVWTGSNQLVLKTCTESVNSWDTFQCSETQWKPVYYTNYKKFFGRWYITTTASYEPLYWKWFINYFKSEVISWVGASSTNIPYSWTQVTRNAAKDSLLNLF